MKLLTKPYLTQVSCWPKTGRHILAQYDDQSIVIYQAYCPAIGNFAAINGYFGSEFKLDRMSWIKANFFWMMYPSGWGTKTDQEVVLAVWLKTAAFAEILAAAVHSSFIPELYGSRREWEKAVKHSLVRLQWDTDYHPSGAKSERRAIQLGLCRQILAAYARNWIVHIKGISEFVRTQRQNIKSHCAELIAPHETVYSVFDSQIQEKLGLSEDSACN